MEDKYSFYPKLEYSEWKLRIPAGTDYGITVIPLKGKEPNSFQRFMCKFLLGFDWVKNK